MQFYVYFWLREDGTPYYVGKGKWKKRQQRALRKGSPSKDKIIVQNYESEAEAFAAEKFFISYFGRKDLDTGCLINLTDGGEGASGHIKLESVRKAISISKLGKPRSEETRRKISDSRIGLNIPFAQREEHSRKMSGSGNPMFGKTRPEGLCSKAGKLGSKKTNHIRWHLNRNKIENNCDFCYEVLDAPIERDNADSCTSYFEAAV